MGKPKRKKGRPDDEGWFPHDEPGKEVNPADLPDDGGSVQDPRSVPTIAGRASPLPRSK
jgi:hypothetical protein